MAEKLFLQVGIVQFGVGVGHLHALDEQLEPLGNRRIAGLPLGQRADARRVVDHEDRARQGVFHLLLKHEALDHVGVLAGRVEAELLGQPRDAGRVVGRYARVLGEQLVVGLSGERRGEVDLLVAPGQLGISPLPLGEGQGVRALTD